MMDNMLVYDSTLPCLNFVFLEFFQKSPGGSSSYAYF